jgi:hypothetical protein
MEIKTVVNKFNRKRKRQKIYYPFTLLVATFIFVLSFLLPNVESFFRPVSILILIILMIDMAGQPEFKAEEKIVYHLKKASDDIDNQEKAKKEIASSIRELESLLSDLKKYPFIEPTVESLSKLVENMRRRVYTALDNMETKKLVPFILEQFSFEKLNSINSINTEIESKLQKSALTPLLYYERPRFYIRFYEILKGNIIMFWNKSVYSRFIATFLVFLGVYLFLVSIALAEINYAIIAALIVVSGGLAVASKESKI